MPRFKHSSGENVKKIDEIFRTILVSEHNITYSHIHFIEVL